jgi:hypothetical protein
MEHFAQNALNHLKKHPADTLDGRSLTILGEELQKGIKENLWIIGVLEEHAPDLDVLQEFKDELKAMAEAKDNIDLNLKRRASEYEKNSSTTPEG